MEESKLLLPITLASVSLDGLHAKYQELRSKYRNTKREFLITSEAIDNEIIKLNHTKRPSRQGVKKHERLVFAAIYNKYDTYLEALQNVRNILSRCLKELVKDYGSGSFHMRARHFRKQRRNLERKITAVTRRKIMAQVSPHAFQGAMVDEAIYAIAPKKLRLDDEINKEELVQWAYIDQFICPHGVPQSPGCPLSNQARDDAAQRRFRADVMKAYGAPDGNFAWCVVLGRFLPNHLIATTHIVGDNLGEVAANHIFGQAHGEAGNGHLVSPQNGLPMAAFYEKLLYDGAIVFEPVDEAATEWKIIVLDDKLRTSEAGSVCWPYGRKLHNRKLSFVNSFRPSKQYLWFSYCVNILRRQRLEVAGWWKDSSLLNDKAIWATPGQYFRRSTIRSMVRLIGNLDEEDAAIMAKRFPALNADSNADTARLDDLIISKVLVKEDKRPQENEYCDFC
ncbi:hypothetical protein O1611_g3679 [Lasiodiplodia mahajangana]|uniref:Uncharacterized protein n=1 Tax=Lasiodiplodia mahajangana TaxID=1108764 RepID=A0ACC2JRG5_9PEZI|nr:hypothetical protein O1611_g3679 [Lasiodiplodia mahajangana]